MTRTRNDDVCGRDHVFFEHPLLGNPFGLIEGNLLFPGILEDFLEDLGFFRKASRQVMVVDDQGLIGILYMGGKFCDFMTKTVRNEDIARYYGNDLTCFGA